MIGTLHEELTPRARECARELGIRLLLVKPYRLPALLEAVRYALTNGHRKPGEALMDVFSANGRAADRVRALSQGRQPASRSRPT